jgi:hypothetical protein
MAGLEEGPSEPTKTTTNPEEGLGLEKTELQGGRDPMKTTTEAQRCLAT